MEKVNVSITAATEDAYKMEAANDTVTAFFKAYTKLSPKMKKCKSKEALALVEDIVSSMNKLSKMLGARGDGKKGGFSNIKHASKKERMAAAIEAKITAATKYVKNDGRVRYTEIKDIKTVFDLMEKNHEDDYEAYIADIKAAIGSNWSKYYSSAYGAESFFKPSDMKASGKKPVVEEVGNRVFTDSLETFTNKGKLWVRSEDFDNM